MYKLFISKYICFCDIRKSKMIKLFNDNLVSHRHQAKVNTFLENIKNNKVPTQNMFSI